MGVVGPAAIACPCPNAQSCEQNHIRLEHEQQMWLLSR
jgi:hypothetical protein